jgi:uncharacterized membrane protein YfhO
MITKEFRTKIRKIFYHYKTLLAIPRYWHVHIVTNDKIKEFANVIYDYQEKTFTITINPKKNKNISVLKDSILHELIHILFTPATARLELLLSKLECNEKVNFKRAKRNMLSYEEAIVSHLAKIIINQEGINEK